MANQNSKSNPASGAAFQAKAQAAQKNAFQSSSSAVVPQAKGALNNLKQEIASELGINLQKGNNGDLSARQAGAIGGQMVKRLIQQAEKNFGGKGGAQSQGGGSGSN